MTTTVADRAVSQPDEPVRRSGAGLVAALAVLAVAVVVLGAASWTGVAPFGSDNDEYRLVARQLLHLDGPVVAGVEGTKYPVGYPAVLAVMDAAGLPPVRAALALNVVLLGVAAALTGLVARHRGAVAAVAAGGVVLVARPLWVATQSTMPDVALTAVVAGTLALLAASSPARRLAIGLAALAVVATALKSVGLLLGLAASASLLWHHRGTKERAWLLAPAASALAVTAVTALVVGRYPEHTTGYARTFWLVDPFDASAGDASTADVARRLPERLDLVLDDAARALWGDLVHGWPAWMLTVALLTAGAVAGRTPLARTLLAGFVVLDLVALAIWPYSSVRFGMPLVPIAALGAGAALAAATRRVPAAAAVTGTAVAVGVLVVLAVPALDREADRQASVFRALDAARAEVAAWLPDGAVPVSPDYRELATALPYGAAVLPISYTNDAAVSLAEAERGTHLVVVRGLYGRREEVVANLLAAHPQRFVHVHQNAHMDVYEIAGRR